MANEITLNVNMSVSKGTLRYTFAPPTASINFTGNAASGGVQNIGTNVETLALVDVTTRGMANFINLSTGTEVEIGSTDGTTFNRFGLLKSGEPAVMRLSAQGAGITSPAVRVIVPAAGTANLQWQVFAD
jgi:hypothetical protein